MHTFITSTYACVLALSCGIQERPKNVLVIPVPKAHKPSPSHAYQAETVRLFRLIPTKEHSGVYATGKLAGSTVSDLYAAYIGKNGVLPENLRINWNDQLKRLWAHKFALTNNTPARDTGTMLTAEYEHLDPERMSLSDYQAIAGRQASLVYRSLNWGAVAHDYFRDMTTKNVDERKLTLLKRVAKNIGGRTLIAYAMTELFPTSGNYSNAYMDFLLRNAGRRYVESLPALHDPLTSFGPFQFTAQAVYDVGTNDAVGGASRVNRALPPRLRIPGSVTLFRGDDHVRAASLFAISNLAVFIRRLDDRHVAMFERIADMRSLELAQFIATAHNKPEVAYASAKRWLDAKAGTTYQHSCPQVSRRYADKTEDNYQSLGRSFTIASN